MKVAPANRAWNTRAGLLPDRQSPCPIAAWVGCRRRREVKTAQPLHNSDKDVSGTLDTGIFETFESEGGPRGAAGREQCMPDKNIRMMGRQWRRFGGASRRNVGLPRSAGAMGQCTASAARSNHLPIPPDNKSSSMTR
eukprot:SAG11_NODE_5512_length_1539_cov_4.026389_1_plen_138_part_00